MGRTATHAAATFLFLLLACCFVYADHRTLVVLDDLSMESTHSMFFKSLTGSE